MRSDRVIFDVAATGIEFTTGAFFGVFEGWLGFIVLVAATGCSVLAFGTDLLAVTVFEFVGVFGVGLVFLVFVSDPTVAAGCSIFDWDTGFSLGVVGFFIVSLRLIRVKRIGLGHSGFHKRPSCNGFYASLGDYVTIAIHCKSCFR